MVDALCVLEVGRILETALGGEAGPGFGSSSLGGGFIAERLLVLWLTFLFRWVWNVLGPQGGVRAILENQVRRYVLVGAHVLIQNGLLTEFFATFRIRTAEWFIT